METTQEIQRVNGAEQPDAFLAVIATAAQNPTFDVGTMKELLAARREELQFQAKVEFKAAMARLQSRLPAITKRGKIVVNNQTRSTYARYEDIDAHCRPLLSEEGFSVSYDNEVVSSGVVWKCIVSHRAGHTETYSTAPLPADDSGSKNKVQAHGSTNQYGRRYAFCNAFNIVTKGEDDDAQASGYISEEQELQVRGMLEACGIDPDTSQMRAFLSFAGSNRVAHIKSNRFSEVMAKLKDKLAKIQQGA